MDFSKRKVTDLKTNRRITTPEHLENHPDIEIVLVSVKSRLANANEEFIASECDRHGNIKDGNLSKEESLGMKSLKERIKSGEISVAPTDKSGKLSVNTLDNYLDKLRPHTIDDELISWKDKEDIERNLNAHSIQLGRILMIGKKWKQEDRVKSALTNHLSHIPSLYGLPKDHKPVPDDTGPKCRPVCGASEAPNGQLSEILSEVVVALCLVVT